MWRTATWLVVLWISACSAWGQDASSADDVRKGHRLAIMVCAFVTLQRQTKPVCQSSSTGTVVRVNCSTHEYQRRMARTVHIYNA
jgi:hypothetical protein